MESDTTPRPVMEPDHVYVFFLKQLQHVSGKKNESVTLSYVNNAIMSCCRRVNEHMVNAHPRKHQVKTVLNLLTRRADAADVAS